MIQNYNVVLIFICKRETRFTPIHKLLLVVLSSNLQYTHKNSVPDSVMYTFWQAFDCTPCKILYKYFSFHLHLCEKIVGEIPLTAETSLVSQGLGEGQHSSSRSEYSFKVGGKRGEQWFCLPLRPTSLMHKNPRTHKTNYLFIACIQQNARINRSIWTCVFVEISCLFNFWGSYYGCCLAMHISLSLCCALKQKDYILISVYCNTEF